MAGLASVAWAGLAHAAPKSFTVALTGAEEVPPVDAASKGSAAITYDPSTHVVTWTVTYSGVTGPATMAHFHGPAEKGKNAAPVVWLTTKGTAAESPFKGEATLTPEQAQQFEAGMWYVNVHSTAHPGGEIRGQVVPPKS
ncbi:MAG TPA: CHRD domain-containing protein [Stellaceae bacterium]|nr:CHRD domain-containing protein [Stellaceae bacterium]